MAPYQRARASRGRVRPRLPQHGRDHRRPAELQAGLEWLCRDYDYRFHGAAGVNANAELVSDPPLLEYLVDRFAMVGRAETIAARMHELSGLCVGGLVVPIIGGDPDFTLGDIGSGLIPLL